MQSYSLFTYFKFAFVSFNTPADSFQSASLCSDRREGATSVEQGRGDTAATRADAWKVSLGSYSPAKGA